MAGNEAAGWRGPEAEGAREFMMARSARERYAFFEPLFAYRGEAAKGDFRAARVLAWKMNAQRDLVRFPELAVRAGHLHTMGLIEEILHHVIKLYLREKDPAAFAEARERLGREHGEELMDLTVLAVGASFPCRAVYAGGVAPEEYARGRTGPTPNAEIILEESLMLSLANRNPAYRPYRELFDDARLADGTAYPAFMDFFTGFFRARAPFGPEGQSLVDMLLAPAKASPGSLEGQLEFILGRWGEMVAPFLSQILTCLDIIREEERPAFTGFDGLEPVPDFRALASREGLGDGEYERYTDDLDWMSCVVLMAKSVFVWLHQLSVAYGREIVRLDQVPDEELDRLERWGFNGLWLIGVWERSPASREIKRRTGNPEAESSAYSLYDYAVAAELGGEGALRDLKDRAWRRGIRLAADMVPNHVGIYSRWVIEHPDWFVSIDHPPFPAYSFNGPDLSSDPTVGIFIEDGYWNRTDAAVVFKRVDRRTGETRYIYHGNDGTGLPWNDTAQLDYLKAEVREAVIGTILHVAGLFPIIRFDAAMTLTRRHYQRLWFPPPGSGGDIPSRAGQGLPTAEFNRRFPNEFWREVVDRASVANPDALLLAEAFWLLEGYFVRTLGMHRVYNSAFMNMLKREANAEYRQTLKNVLEFDPEILKRFVNFMNNPDEETAVAQFGREDKYFGTAVMLATLPGLPMFGHGQVEGLREKYGMEYRRSYHDEAPDKGLVARHEREIFPLLRRRRIFSEAAHFTLYDFWRDGGSVDENVYAYSNRRGGERSLVVYNNVYAHTAGWIRDAAAFLEKTPGGERRLVRRSLGEELGLEGRDGHFCLFRDAVHGLEYLRPCRELVEQGLRVVLGAFQYHVFLDFRTVPDPDGELAELRRRLEGRGVPSLREALAELRLAPLHAAFGALLDAGRLERLLSRAYVAREEAVDEWGEDLRRFLALGRPRAEAEGPAPDPAPLIMDGLRSALSLASMAGGEEAVRPPAAVVDILRGGPASWAVMLACLAARGLSKAAPGAGDAEEGAALLEELMLPGELEKRLLAMGLPETEASGLAQLALIITARRGWLNAASAGAAALAPAVEALLADIDVQKYIGVHRHREVVWFVKERFENLAAWLCLDACLGSAGDEGNTPDLFAAYGATCARLVSAAEASGYMLERLVAEIETAAAKSGDG